MYLQNVIKQVTDQSLETLAQNNVFQPLGMLHSSFLPPDRPGYMAQTISSHAKSKETPKTSNAANSVHTTASDYAKLMTAWMRDPSPIMKQAPCHQHTNATSFDTHGQTKREWYLNKNKAQS